MAIYFGLSPFDLPLTLESIGNHWAQETISRPEGYPLYHWLQTEQGSGTIEIGTSVFSLKPGEGILIVPDIPHLYYRTGELWTTSFATFTGTLRQEIPKITGSAPFTLVSAADGQKYSRWVSKIIQAHEHRQLDAAELSGQCYAFLMSFVYGKQSRELADQPLYQKYVLPVIKEIETNYSQPLTVTGLCSQVYVTPQYLSRLFKRFLGSSVYTYLMNYRIQKAKELLMNRPETEIQHIAHQVGFQDASHFISVFRTATGYTPLEFRKLH